MAAPHVITLSEIERREFDALSAPQQRAYKNLRESEIAHRRALAIATDVTAGKLHAAHVDELHVTAAKIVNAIEDRDDAIRKAHVDGVSPETIAEAVGLTRQRVHQIVAKDAR